MRKFTLNSPAVILIELDGPSIRLDHSKAKRVVSTTAYFAFGMCQQFTTDASPAAVAANPQIADPFIPRHRYAQNLFA